MAKLNLRSIGFSILKTNASFVDAVRKFADRIADSDDLRLALAADYLKKLPRPERRKEISARRRVGPHRKRSTTPTAAQKKAAVKAEKIYVETIFDHKIRGGRKLGDVRVNELRAIAENSANTSVSFFQRGYEDAVETFVALMLSRHCVAADPFAKVRDTIKASVVKAVLDKAKISAAELIRDRSAKVAADLIAAANAQELPAP